MEAQDWNQQTRNMLLALYVLSGAITQDELESIIQDEAPVPSAWQEIIEFIQNKRSK